MSLRLPCDPLRKTSSVPSMPRWPNCHDDHGVIPISGHLRYLWEEENAKLGICSRLIHKVAKDSCPRVPRKKVLLATSYVPKTRQEGKLWMYVGGFSVQPQPHHSKFTARRIPFIIPVTCLAFDTSTCTSVHWRESDFHSKTLWLALSLSLAGRHPLWR